MTPPVIEVRNLTIDYATATGQIRAAASVNFTVASSEILGLVGESGSGKSTVAMALLGHIAPSASMATGQVLLRGQNLFALPPTVLAGYRGRRIGFVPQNPSMGLAPHLRVGRQFSELVVRHRVATGPQQAEEMAAAHFALVGLPEPDLIGRRYAHELSGGQQQRVAIAMAVACLPELLILDEPTTGLDVTTQARIIELLKDLRSRFGICMLYVTHDMALLAQIADRVGVMYAGHLVEVAPADRLFDSPVHPYSRALLASVPSLDIKAVTARPLEGILQRDALPPGCPFSPRCERSQAECAEQPQRLQTISPQHAVACRRWDSIVVENGIEATDESAPARLGSTLASRLVELENVSLAYSRRGFWRRLFKSETAPVVNDVSLSIDEGEIFALVGESGSGKSTIARAIAGLLAPVNGHMHFRGRPLAGRLGERPIEVKREIQYVFQNPDASLNPRERVRASLARPLRLYFKPNRTLMGSRVAKALQEVQLDPLFNSRYPDQLSGGERQRVAVARALVAQPALILCDEVLSALDVSIQASVLELLARLREQTGVAMLFISHDLAVVRKLSDRTAVLFRGSIVEVGPTKTLFQPPYHPYTEELLLALPAYLKRLRKPLKPADPAKEMGQRSGCVYAGRCRHQRGAVCDNESPPWQTTSSGHAIRCHISLAELASENIFAEEDCA